MQPGIYFSNLHPASENSFKNRFLTIKFNGPECFFEGEIISHRTDLDTGPEKPQETAKRKKQ